MPNWDSLRGPCALLSALAMLRASLPGCAFVGAGVGAGIDSLIPGPYEEQLSPELVRLERDERVLVALRNGTRVAGRYRGTLAPTAADLDRSPAIRQKGQGTEFPISAAWRKRAEPDPLIAAALAALGFAPW